MRHLPTFVKWTVAKFIYDHPKLKHRVKIEFVDKPSCKFIGKCIRPGRKFILRFNLPLLERAQASSKYGAEDVILHECVHMVMPVNEHHGKRFKAECHRIGISDKHCNKVVKI